MQALRALARAQIELLSAQLLVWRRPVGQLVAFGDSGYTTEPERPADHRGEATRAARAIQRAATYGVFRPRCLVRALALHRYLGRMGLTNSVVRIGVRREANELLAHAWVEYDGLVFGETKATAATFALLTEARLADLSGGSP